MKNERLPEQKAHESAAAIDLIVSDEVVRSLLNKGVVSTNDWSQFEGIALTKGTVVSIKGVGDAVVESVEDKPQLSQEQLRDRIFGRGEQLTQAKITLRRPPFKNPSLRE